MMLVEMIFNDNSNRDINNVSAALTSMLLLADNNGGDKDNAPLVTFSVNDDSSCGKNDKLLIIMMIEFIMMIKN